IQQKQLGLTRLYSRRQRYFPMPDSVSGSRPYQFQGQGMNIRIPGVPPIVPHGDVPAEILTVPQEIRQSSKQQHGLIMIIQSMMRPGQATEGVRITEDMTTFRSLLLQSGQ